MWRLVQANMYQSVCCWVETVEAVTFRELVKLTNISEYPFSLLLMMDISRGPGNPWDPISTTLIKGCQQGFPYMCYAKLGTETIILNDVTLHYAEQPSQS